MFRRAITAAVLSAALLSSPALAAAPVPVQWYNPATGQSITVAPGALGLPVREQSLVQAYGTSPLVPGISCIMVSIPDGQIDNPAGTYTNRDSTAVIDVRGYKYAAILMWARPTFPGDKGSGTADSLIGATFALQARCHPTSSYDSANVYRNVGGMRRSESGLGTGAVVATNDSVGMMRDMLYARNFNITPSSILGNPLPDEKVVVVGNGVTGGQVVWADRINNPASGWVTGFMSWRLRALKSFCNVSGSPAAPANEMAMRIRFDILLWND